MRTRLVHEFDGLTGQYHPKTPKNFKTKYINRYIYTFMAYNEESDAEELNLAMFRESWSRLACHIIQTFGVDKDIQEAYDIATRPDTT